MDVRVPCALFICLLALSFIGSGLGAKRLRSLSVKDITPNNRTKCPETSPPPPNRVYTAARVAALRGEMRAFNLHAYFIPMEDAHGDGGSSADYDKRVQYISGFSGSTAYAWVLNDTAQALWTDGRYFLQADDQMDCHWTLMKMGQAGYPTAEEWLLSVVPQNGRVGAYPNYVGIGVWQSYEKALEAKGITMVEVQDELIDRIWTANRTDRPNNDIFIHTTEFAGETWQSKIQREKEKLLERESSLLVITALDEIVWTFNLRGSDKVTSPVFYAYAMIFSDANPRLYLVNHMKFKNDTALQNHLGLVSNGSCNAGGLTCAEIKEYDEFFTDLSMLSELRSNIWVDPFSSYAALSSSGNNSFVDYSPIQLMKSVKNDVERRRYYDCQLRDSAALVEFMAELDQQVNSGNNNNDELSASNRLTNIRSQYDHNHGISFYPISAVGANAAIIHYRPETETNKNITKNEIYLLDSGGQYLDGTTDVTRTFHFGTPTDAEKAAYTRVLLGVINLAMAVWPEGTYGRDIDALARLPLWREGLDYNHGTGHGIAYFINVHEGPGRIAQGYNPANTPLYEGMFFSDEPGYYEADAFGIRLETIVGIVKANTTHRFNDKDYLTFVPYTLVPFEPKLIIINWLNDNERSWLNEYHARCRDETAQYLLNIRGDAGRRGYEWIMGRTSAIEMVGAVPPVAASVSLLTLCLSALLALFSNL